MPVGVKSSISRSPNQNFMPSFAFYGKETQSINNNNNNRRTIIVLQLFFTVCTVNILWEGKKTVCKGCQQTRLTHQIEWKAQINFCTNYCTKLESLFCTPLDFLRDYLYCVLSIHCVLCALYFMKFRKDKEHHAHSTKWTLNTIRYFHKRTY